MMNVFALGLLFTSLVTAGFFSPTPEKQNSKENIVLKDGHRVVVEFEKDNGNTKVSISPQDHKGSTENMEDKVSETSEGVNGRLKEEDSAILEEIHRGFSPSELVCDAYGKCKHKIAAAMGKTKEAVAEKAHEVEEEAGEAIGKAKDTITHSAHRVSDKARESTENVKESAREAKDKFSEKASEMKEGASVQAEKAKSHASEKAKEAEEMVGDVSDRVKQGTQRVKEEGKRELRGSFQRARAIGLRVFASLVPSMLLNSVSGVLHLLGFTAAYGMCIWVTFASSYVLAVALPRHQFGMVQSKIYPVYFKAMTYCVGVALFGHLLSQRKRLSPVSVGMFQSFNLVVSLVMVLANMLYLEPRATKVMFERMKMEKEEGRGKESGDTEPRGRNVDPTTESLAIGLSSTGGSPGSAEGKQADTEAEAKAEMARMTEMLRRLNSYSSFLNVLTLMSLTCHLVYLGQRLHIAC
ncbi:uncharacterized protein LOC142523423 [Primulina tabacum]|uniref:uncharacterized protein LOC142523423 n=1 Tax=Primulina tabacum TaxID=48773 RepID=UPI003F59C510